MVVPKANVKRGRGIKAFDKIIVRILEAASDVYLTLKAGGKFEIETEAGATVMEVTNDTGVVSIGTLAVSSKAELPYGTGADILIATLTTAFGAPGATRNGEVMVYRDTGANKTYLVCIGGDAFYLEELTAAAAA